MKIITIASAKGGVSKSLLAINLFDYLKNEENKKVLLLDIDAQKSAFDFLDELGEEDIAATSDESEVLEVLSLCKKEKYDFVVIDTAPTITKLNATIIKQSDKVLIAVKPARFDIKSVYNTIDLVKESKAKSCVLLTQTINNSSNTKKNIEELREIFDKEKVMVLNNTLSNSVAYVNCINNLQIVFKSKYTKQKIELAKIFASLLTC